MVSCRSGNKVGVRSWTKENGPCIALRGYCSGVGLLPIIIIIPRRKAVPAASWSAYVVVHIRCQCDGPGPGLFAQQNKLKIKEIADIDFHFPYFYSREHEMEAAFLNYRFFKIH